MSKTTRANRRQFNSDTRIIARNLRAAARHDGMTWRELRAVEQRHRIPAGRLLLALAGIRLLASDMILLQFELGLSVSQVFAGTSRSKQVPA